MTKPDEIKWSSYQQFEGPFFIGMQSYKLPEKPELNDKILATITATEGGHWDAINMYDRCICTVGLIQWCEGGQYSVSDMLGVVVDRRPNLIEMLRQPMAQAGILAFKKNSKDRYRFFFSDGRGEVDRTIEQQQMFLYKSNGTKGSWDQQSRDFAKLWAASLSSLFQVQDAIEAQRDYTVPRLYGFALKTALELFKEPEAKSTPIGQAFICAYLSFAANNPARADRSLQEALKTWDGSKGPKWSPRWLIHILDKLTFFTGVSIYPHRYNAIRPVLERFFGIDLPDRAEQLEGLLTPNEIQDILVHKLGYDLGKSGPKGDGVDGAWGGKSKAALMDFERRNNLDGDGLPDAKTNEALLRVRDAA
jgi:hypothetical protein